MVAVSQLCARNNDDCDICAAGDIPITGTRTMGNFFHRLTTSPYINNTRSPSVRLKVELSRVTETQKCDIKRAGEPVKK